MDCMRYDPKVLIVNLSELVQFSCLQLTDTYLPYLRKNEPLLRLFSLDKALSSKTHMQGAVCETGSLLCCDVTIAAFRWKRSMHARENQIETTNGKLKFFFPFKKKVGNGIYF